MKRCVALVLVVLTAAALAGASQAADVYAGYSKVGSATAGYGGRYDVSAGYRKVGYLSASYGGRWDVYSGYRKIGYVTASSGGRWDVYSGYRKVGYVNASSGGRWTCTPAIAWSARCAEALVVPPAAPLCFFCSNTRGQRILTFAY